MDMSSSTKSHKTKQPLWLNNDVLRAADFEISQNDSANICFVEGRILESRRKSRNIIMSRFSDIVRYLLAVPNGSAVAGASAPSMRSSKVTDVGP